MLRFRGVIQIRGVNPYVRVSTKLSNQLKRGWRKPLPVLVRINGLPRKPWRINMMPVGDGSFYLYLRGPVRATCNVKVGDRVTVDLSFDNRYRSGPTHPIPEWFRKALNDNANARGAWNALVPSRKKEILRYFAALKSEEAKARNLTKALEVLSGSEARFMARSWNQSK
jgi:hypothetical protein